MPFVCQLVNEVNNKWTKLIKNIPRTMAIERWTSNCLKGSDLIRFSMHIANKSVVDRNSVRNSTKNTHF